MSDVTDLIAGLDTQRFVATLFKAFNGIGLVDAGGIDFVAERGDKRMIVVAAAPRTGSTYLANVLAKLTQFPMARLCAGYSTNEHDLYLPALCFMNRIGCVSQLHVKGTFHNAALMRSFGIKPVVLVRNIFDIVVSLMGDLRDKERHPDFGTGFSGYSFLWQDENIRSCSDERLLDVIVDLVVPWYVNFYVSWHRLCEQGAANAKWVTYEDLMADKAGTVHDVLDFLDARVVASDVDRILALRTPTFVEGSSGRGERTLSAAQKERIRRLFSYYPDIDFRYYGLP